ncbi:MAG TPA: GNAT family N-acetyltransferase [Candidatus Dormibacteraeota bacterium]|jgi:ribosomal protein S18 acetylase RimI-like enzyme|nr:GNAT family N-acetyltransferase [Candidatus Dormibacteraeota bacterium]
MAVSLVRSAEVEDATAIARVHVATWRTAYHGLLPDDFLDSLSEDRYEERWRRTIADQGSGVYVAEDGHEVVAFASGGRERAGEDGFAGELYAIYVMRESQGRGHGRALVRAVTTGLREMGLTNMIVWVLRDNPAARRFYERLGGTYIREQPITIGSAQLQEISYGWRSLDSITY